MERIISDERLQSIVRRAYRAGKGGVEAFTQVGADGPEVIRCRDCKNFAGAVFGRSGYWCSFLEFGAKTDGFCAWAERDA